MPAGNKDSEFVTLMVGNYNIFERSAINHSLQRSILRPHVIFAKPFYLQAVIQRQTAQAIWWQSSVWRYDYYIGAMTLLLQFTMWINCVSIFPCLIHWNLYTQLLKLHISVWVFISINFKFKNLFISKIFYIPKKNASKLYYTCNTVSSYLVLSSITQPKSCWNQLRCLHSFQIYLTL